MTDPVRDAVVLAIKLLHDPESVDFWEAREAFAEAMVLLGDEPGLSLDRRSIADDMMRRGKREILATLEQYEPERFAASGVR